MHIGGGITFLVTKVIPAIRNFHPLLHTVSVSNMNVVLMTMAVSNCQYDIRLKGHGQIFLKARKATSSCIFDGCSYLAH